LKKFERSGHQKAKKTRNDQKRESKAFPEFQRFEKAGGKRPRRLGGGGRIGTLETGALGEEINLHNCLIINTALRNKSCWGTYALLNVRLQLGR